MTRSNSLNTFIVTPLPWRFFRFYSAILILALLLCTPLSCSNDRPLQEIPLDIPAQRPAVDGYCFDFIQSLEPGTITRINNHYAHLLRKYFDIDPVIIIVHSLGDHDINEKAAAVFSDWQIGRSIRGKKGLLLLVAREDQTLRIETGYDLEHIFTDLFVARAERELLKEFFEQGVWDEAFLSFLENLSHRVETRSEKGEDISGLSSSGSGPHFSGGGGATATFDFAAALDKTLPESSHALKKYFSAQPSPLMAYERYMEHCARQIRDRSFDLFSDSTKDFYHHWHRGTSAQKRMEAQSFDGLPVISRINGQYAVVMVRHGNDAEKIIQKNPYFFIRAEKGWQIDISTMAHTMIMFNATGGWHFMSTHHPYMFAYQNFVIKTNRMYPYSGQTAFLGINYGKWNADHLGFEIIPEFKGPLYKAGGAYPMGGDKMKKDILLSIDGIPITRAYQDWNDLMFRYQPGDRVKVRVFRDNRVKTLKPVLERPIPFGKSFFYSRTEKDPWFGLYLAGSMPYERKAAGSHDISFVVDVLPQSPAAQAGIQAGDLILDCWDRLIAPVRTGGGNIKPGHSVRLEVIRNLAQRLKISVTAGSFEPGCEGI